MGKDSKSKALSKKKENSYDKSFREGKIPPHARGSSKAIKELGESFAKRREEASHYGSAQQFFLNASKKDPRHYRTDMESEEGQRKNAQLRKGKKRPEHGQWPIAK